jgi:hypothetical protein
MPFKKIKQLDKNVKNDKIDKSEIKYNKNYKIGVGFAYYNAHRSGGCGC